MPDSPDYLKYLPNSNRFSLQDLGELAARLGSAVHFDRRGEVVFYDTFEHGLGGWVAATSGTGASVALIANHNYRYPFVARLICGTTGTKTTSLQKRIGGIETKRAGVEFIIALNLGDYLLQFEVDVNDGVNSYQLSIRFNGTTFEWSILNSSAVYQTVATQPIEVGLSYIYVPVKIVADLETGYYVRLLIGKDEFDISDVALNVVASSTAVNYDISIINVGDGSTNTELYVAHVIVTANEP